MGPQLLEGMIFLGLGLSSYSTPAIAITRRTIPLLLPCVGESDGIANWHTMQRRLDAMSNLGIPTEFHHYPGLPHGFGLGTNTVAEGWLNEAIAFWEAQM